MPLSYRAASEDFNLLRVYDNSGWGKAPSLLLESRAGKIVFSLDLLPDWLTEVMR